MKIIISLVLTLTMFNLAKAQVKKPVHWSFSSKMINATTFEIHLTAAIDAGWHIYSQTTPDGGPVPTSIKFGKNPLITLIGKTKEVGKLEKHKEPLFGGIDVKQFSDNVDFVQTIKLKGYVKITVNGSVSFMCCNDHECLPPSKQPFSIVLE